MLPGLGCGGPGWSLVVAQGRPFVPELMVARDPWFVQEGTVGPAGRVGLLLALLLWPVLPPVLAVVVAGPGKGPSAAGVGVEVLVLSPPTGGPAKCWPRMRWQARCYVP